MSLPTSAANVSGAHVSPPPTCIAARLTPGVSLPYHFSRLPVWFSAEIPNAQNLNCWKPKAERGGGSLRKTHPSGKGWGNFPRSGGRSTRFFQTALILLSHPQPPRTTWAAQCAGRWSREGGERRLPDHPEGAVRAEIPAWRKRGPAPARGRRRRRAPSVHRSSRR